MIDSWTVAAIIAAAGFAAGVINAVVGSGTLVTFSALLAVGIPPVTANGTNTTGLFPGAFTAAYVYRNELLSRLRQLRIPLLATTMGAGLGAALVVSLPDEVFTNIVPWLIALATVMVAVQPIRSKLASRKQRSLEGTRSRALWPWTGAVGIYGGYFGAAQGVVLMAVLTWLYDERPQYSNAAKNLLAATANSVAAVIFISVGAISWPAAGILAISSTLGGYWGGRWARRLPETVLRGMVIAVGIIATTTLVIN